MKHIVLDSLRRWSWLYAVGSILALGLNVMAAYVPSFSVFTPYFLAPMLGPLFVLGFDLMRGTAGLAVALPISARKVGMGYWIVGVCVPAVLLTVALVAAAIVAVLFGAPQPPGWEQVVSTLVISFLTCGCIFLVLTCFRVGPQEGLWNNVVASLAGGLWGIGAFAGIGVKYLLDFRGHDIVLMAVVACAALVGSAVGFLRCEQLVRSRARIRLAQRTSPGRSEAAATATELTKSGPAGFPYLFLEGIKFSLGMALGFVLFGFMLRTVVPVSSPFTQYTLLACALLPGLRYCVGLRQLRAFPISLDALALILFLLPLTNFSVCAGLLAMVEAITGTGTFAASPATLSVTAAITSLGSAMLVRFGPKSLPIAFAVGIMSLFAIPTDLFLAVYAGSAALLITAYAILRSSLRSSNLYRVPAGSFAAG